MFTLPFIPEMHRSTKAIQEMEDLGLWFGVLMVNFMSQLGQGHRLQTCLFRVFMEVPLCRQI